MNKWIKARISTFLGTTTAARAVFLADGVLIRFARKHDSASTFECLVVAAPGAGNIGDQALLESTLDNTHGRVVVVVRDGADFVLPARYRDRVSMTVFPHLLYGDPIRRCVDYTRFLRLARGAQEAWLIGADTMDGAYNSLASVTRFSAIFGAAAMGARARVLGFSWNDHPTDSARWSARACDGRVGIYARDPISHDRLLRDGVVDAQLCADIVFARECGTSEGSEASGWIDEQKSRGRKVVVVNCSGLIGNDELKRAEYEYLVGWLQDQSWSIVFVPHVIRPGNDDLALIRAILAGGELRTILAGGEGDRMFVVDRLLSPDAIHTLVSRVDLVVTGRMHLAVLSILGGIIPITLATQGKVEGLYRMLGCESLCIEPVADFGRTITDTFPQALAANRTFDLEAPLLTELRDLAKSGLHQKTEIQRGA